MAKSVFKGFKQVTASFSDFQDGIIYFVRTSEDYSEGFIHFNGKEYGTTSNIWEVLGDESLLSGNTAFGLISSITQVIGNPDLLSGETLVDKVLGIKSVIGDGNILSGKTISEFLEELDDTDKTLIETLGNVVTFIGDKSQIPSGVSLVEYIIDNEEVISTALNDLNTRISGATDALTAETVAREAADAALLGDATATTKDNATIWDVKRKVESLTASTHSHENKEVLDTITSADTAAWSAAEQNAKDYADSAVTDEAAAREAADNVINSALTNEVNAREALEEAVGDTTQLSGETVVDAMLANERVTAAALVELNEAIENIEVPEYTIAKSGTSGDYAAVYYLTKDGVKVGEEINIPKDMVVRKAAVVEYDGSASAITVEGETVDVVGTHAAGKYVVMLIANDANSQVWLDVADIAHIYTEGSGITISNTDVVSVKLSNDTDNALSFDANGGLFAAIYYEDDDEIVVTPPAN